MSETPTAPVSRGMLWGGRVFSGLAVFGLVMSAVMKLIKTPVLEEFVRFGYPESTIIPIGVVELIAVLVYAFPKTAVLGAVLCTGYLGGAVATHVRISDPVHEYVGPIILGAFIWLGLVLRDPKLRSLLPIRW